MILSLRRRFVNKIWLLLTDTVGNLGRYPNYYNNLNDTFNSHMLSSKRIIEMDILRTNADTITPEIKAKMRRILYNYAKRNMKIGYCQGMNFICFYFLSCGFTEEETFWILVYIIENLIPRDYYINMVPIISDIKMFRHILNEKCPKLVQQIQKISVDLNFILIPWFVMAFANIDNDEVS